MQIQNKYITKKILGDYIWEYRADIIVKLLQYIDPNDVLERKIDNRSINEDLLNRICYVLDKETGEATISKKIEALRDDLNFEIHEDSYTVNNRVNRKRNKYL